MREKIQHSNFFKSIAAFLIVPIIFIASFSFPRPAQAEFLVPILITAILSSLTLGLATVFIIDATTCYINIVWGCSNTAPDGTVTAITVTPTAVTLSASPPTIDSGESSTLTWSSTNATSCTSMGGFSTSGAANNLSPGVSTGVLTSTQYYQISCDGIGASTNSNIVTVTVLQPTVSINAAPSRVVRDSSGNGSTIISWDATSINDCTITRNGVVWQTLTADASRTVSGSAPDTVTGQTTYAISCTNNASAGAVAASAQQIVNVVSSFQEF